MAKEPNYSLDKEKASEMLNNILDTCNLPPSSNSYEANNSIVKKIKRKEIIGHEIIAAIFLLIAVISPLFFKADPQFKVLNSTKSVAVSSHFLYDNCFVMTLSGSADYPNIYARKNDDALIFPDQADSSTGVVIFPYNGDALNIFIPTKNGEFIQAVLNEKE